MSVVGTAIRGRDVHFFTASFWADARGVPAGEAENESVPSASLSISCAARFFPLAREARVRHLSRTRVGIWTHFAARDGDICVGWNVVAAVACVADAGGTVAVAMAARYWMTFLVFSVFPAPDSPLRRISSSVVKQRLHMT